MKKYKIKSPFLVVNPKSYLYGEEALKLAKTCDLLSEKYGIDVIFTAQHVDIKSISSSTQNIIVTAQHMDGHSIGRGMGKILGEGLVEAGAKATFLNHAEHPMTLSELTESINKANELGIITIVCANSIKEARIIAHYEPDVIVCEPNELIGTGNTSSFEYMSKTNNEIHAINKEIKVLQAAGISSGEDVYSALKSGADASGGTSGIVCSENPELVIKDMMEWMEKWKKEMNFGDVY